MRGKNTIRHYPSISTASHLVKFLRLVRKDIYPYIDFDLYHNAKYTNKDFLDVLTHVSTSNDFANNGTMTLKIIHPERDVPHPHTVMYHMRNLALEEWVEMFDEVTDAIYLQAKRMGVFQRPVDIAIDFTDLPYYGDKNDFWVVGGKHKKGTNWFHRFASVHIVVAGRRFTLKVIPINSFSKSTTERVIKELIENARKRVRIRNVYLDREFYNVSCIKVLNSLRVNWLMRAKKSKRIKDWPKQYKTSHVERYTMGEAIYVNKSTTFNLVMVRGEKVRREEGYVLFATNMNITDEAAEDLLDLYETRWGIETGYRLINQFRAKTTSRDIGVRYFEFMFSVSLYNLWVLANIWLGVVLGESYDNSLVTAKMFQAVLVSEIDPG